jgi:hypothetical protein
LKGSPRHCCAGFSHREEEDSFESGKLDGVFVSCKNAAVDLKRRFDAPVRVDCGQSRLECTQTEFPGFPVLGCAPVSNQRLPILEERRNGFFRRGLKPSSMSDG